MPLLKQPRDILAYGVIAAFLIASLFFIVDANNPLGGTVAAHPNSFKILRTDPAPFQAPYE
jgi:hypothetical protein